MSTFEDYKSGALAIVAVVVVGIGIHNEYSKYKDIHDERKANRFMDHTKARMRSLHNHIMANHGSKEAYIEAFTMAKNIIQFDVVYELEGNVYTPKVVAEVTTYIDQMIANI